MGIYFFFKKILSNLYQFLVIITELWARQGCMASFDNLAFGVQFSAGPQGASSI